MANATNVWQPWYTDYKTEKCSVNMEMNLHCFYGDKCKFLHRGEKPYPSRLVINERKIKGVNWMPCRREANPGGCTWGNKCLFLHEADYVKEATPIQPLRLPLDVKSPPVTEDYKRGQLAQVPRQVNNFVDAAKPVDQFPPLPQQQAPRRQAPQQQAPQQQAPQQQAPQQQAPQQQAPQQPAVQTLPKVLASGTKWSDVDDKPSSPANDLVDQNKILQKMVQDQKAQIALLETRVRELELKNSNLEGRASGLEQTMQFLRSQPLPFYSGPVIQPAQQWGSVPYTQGQRVEEDQQSQHSNGSSTPTHPQAIAQPQSAPQVSV